MKFLHWHATVADLQAAIDAAAQSRGTLHLQVAVPNGLESNPAALDAWVAMMREQAAEQMALLIAPHLDAALHFEILETGRKDPR